MLKVYVLSVYENTGTTHRYPTIEHYDAWKPVEEVLTDTQEKYQGDPRVARLFIKDEEGNRRTFRPVGTPDDRGFHSGRWEWHEFTLGWTDVKLHLNPNPCNKCTGLGHIDWGRVQVRHRGQDIRICFDCKGRGFITP